ncbi:hypothetical protein BJX65DRAFT_310381 [Aspergillus insuetus]
MAHHIRPQRQLSQQIRLFTPHGNVVQHQTGFLTILNSTLHGGQPYHDHDISSQDDYDSLYEDEYNALSEDDYDTGSENDHDAHSYKNYDAYSEYDDSYDEDSTTAPSDPFVYSDQALGEVDVLQVTNDGRVYQAYGQPPPAVQAYSFPTLPGSNQQPMLALLCLWICLTFRENLYHRLALVSLSLSTVSRLVRDVVRGFWMERAPNMALAGKEKCEIPLLKIGLGRVTDAVENYSFCTVFLVTGDGVGGGFTRQGYKALRE